MTRRGSPDGLTPLRVLPIPIARCQMPPRTGPTLTAQKSRKSASVPVAPLALDYYILQKRPLGLSRHVRLEEV